MWAAAAVARGGRRALPELSTAHPACGIALLGAPSADLLGSFEHPEPSQSWVVGPCSHGIAPTAAREAVSSLRWELEKAAISAAVLLRDLLGGSSYCCSSWCLLASLRLRLHFKTVLLTRRTFCRTPAKLFMF